MDESEKEHDSDAQATIAILLDQSFDDWLSGLGVSLDEFIKLMMGSWVFNYVEALQKAGARPVLVCVSDHVTTMTRLTHAPTGAHMLVCPPTRVFRLLCRWFPKHFSRHDKRNWHEASVCLGGQLCR